MTEYADLKYSKQLGWLFEDVEYCFYQDGSIDGEDSTVMEVYGYKMGI